MIAGQGEPDWKEKAELLAAEKSELAVNYADLRHLLGEFVARATELLAEQDDANVDVKRDDGDAERMYLHRGYLRGYQLYRRCLLYRKWDGLWRYLASDGSWVEAADQNDSRYVEVGPCP